MLFTDKEIEFFIMYYIQNYFDFRVKINCTSNVRSIHIYNDSTPIKYIRDKRGSLSRRFSDSILFQSRKKRDIMPHGKLINNL